MKSAVRIFSLACVVGLTLLQFSCDDANADGKEGIKVEKEPPAQPQKPVIKTDEEWKKLLTPEQYEILRKHGTERPWGKVYEEFKKQGAGIYYCAGCNAELFTSKEKSDLAKVEHNWDRYMMCTPIQEITPPTKKEF